MVYSDSSITCDCFQYCFPCYQHMMDHLREMSGELVS